MKGGIKAGFAFLQEHQYNKALHCFTARLGSAKTQADINTCLYGKARAQMGLKNYDVAIGILEKLITNNPQWEVPYVTLARMYEDRNMLKEAERTYLRAVNNKIGSKKLLKNFEWFLEHRLLPVQLQQQQAQAHHQPQQQQPFLPGLQVHRQRYHAGSKRNGSQVQQNSGKIQKIVRR